MLNSSKIYLLNRHSIQPVLNVNVQAGRRLYRGEPWYRCRECKLHKHRQGLGERSNQNIASTIVETGTRKTRRSVVNRKGRKTTRKGI